MVSSVTVFSTAALIEDKINDKTNIAKYWTEPLFKIPTGLKADQVAIYCTQCSWTCDHWTQMHLVTGRRISTWDLHIYKSSAPPLGHAVSTIELLAVYINFLVHTHNLLRKGVTFSFVFLSHSNFIKGIKPLLLRRS